MPHIFLRRCKRRWRVVGTVEGNATIRGAVAQYSRFVTPPTWVTFGRCSAHSACEGAALFSGRKFLASWLVISPPDLQIWTHSFRGFHKSGWLGNLPVHVTLLSDSFAVEDHFSQLS